MQELIKVAIQTLHTDMQNLAHAWQVTLCPKCSSCYTAVATLSAYQRLCCLASMPGLLCLFDTAPDVASCMIVKHPEMGRTLAKPSRCSHTKMHQSV